MVFVSPWALGFRLIWFNAKGLGVLGVGFIEIVRTLSSRAGNLDPLWDTIIPIQSQSFILSSPRMIQDK